MSIRYDERQMTLRHKYGFQSFSLLLILTLLNALFVDLVYAWASTTISSCAIIIISITYFAIRTINDDAFAPLKKSASMITLSIACLLQIIVIVIFIIYGKFQFFHEGVASRNFLNVLVSLTLLPVAIVYWCRWYKAKKQGE